MLSAKQLDYAYRHEPDANVRERILLTRRVRVDNQEAASVAELELHRSRGWAYKWLKRYNSEDIQGLKDKPRSGRPPDVSEEKLLEIRKELSENPSGWKVKQIMNIIYERTGVMYHEVHVYRLLHKWRFKPSTTKEICQYSIKRRERSVQKKTKQIISRIPKDFTVVVEDESIFIHDAFRRKMWTPEVIRPVVSITGSHQKTCVFGALCIDGRQFFRQ